MQLPAPQTIDPTTAALFHLLIQAQHQNNALQAQARDEERRSRIELAPTKFPRLNCLSQETIASWYPRVVVIIQQAKYSQFFDPISADILPNGSFDPQLNTLLFSELLSSFSQAIQDYVYRHTEI